MKYEYGFIGVGNMGGAIADAVARSVSGARLACADFVTDKCERLKNAYGFGICTNKEIAKYSRFIVLGVKPQVMAKTLEDIAPVLESRDDRFVLVTMAAGIKTEKICELAGGEYPVIRIMPNIPVSVGEGMILCTKNGAVSDSDLSDFVQAMKYSGKLDMIEEKLIDGASAVSGCGPAFVSIIAEALADGGVECGLPRDKALLYAEQTLIGTAEYLLKTETHPAALKDAVSSPGGTTIVGVHELESGNLRASLMNAVVAAYKKSIEVGKA